MNLKVKAALIMLRNFIVIVSIAIALYLLVTTYPEICSIVFMVLFGGFILLYWLCDMHDQIYKDLKNKQNER